MSLEKTMPVIEKLPSAITRVIWYGLVSLKLNVYCFHNLLKTCWFFRNKIPFREVLCLARVIYVWFGLFTLSWVIS